MAGIASNSLALARDIGDYLQAYREKWNQTSKAISDFELLHHELATQKEEWKQMLNDYGLANDQRLRHGLTLPQDTLTRKG